MKIYLGLIHHPIQNKRGDVVTTSVTNLDIHDIARSCRTFGVERYFIVTPLKAQHELVERILGHWKQERSLAYNPDRQDALSVAQLTDSFDDAMMEIEKIEGKRPLIVATGANFKNADGGLKELQERQTIDKRAVFLLFGTGWGLHASLLDRVEFRLDPIRGASRDGYNHLSVRSAVAIYLDRLCNGL